MRDTRQAKLTQCVKADCPVSRLHSQVKSALATQSRASTIGDQFGPDRIAIYPMSAAGMTEAAGLDRNQDLDIFRRGMRHIAEGTDHLLFLLALLLPAPLMAVGAHWTGFAEVRTSFLRILGIVTAFSIGHSLTLALAAWGLIRVPSRPIEVLIAFSILISAIHAFRPIFPGREARIAAFFGLIHQD